MRDDAMLDATKRALAERCPAAGSRWRHRKGGKYEIIGGAVVEATLTPAVL